MSSVQVRAVVRCSKCGKEVNVPVEDYHKLFPEGTNTVSAKVEIELGEEAVYCWHCGMQFAQNQKYTIVAVTVGWLSSRNSIAQYFLLRSLEEYEAGNLNRAKRFAVNALLTDPMIVLRERMPNAIPVTVGPNSIDSKFDG